jgi:signal peptidase I
MASQAFRNKVASIPASTWASMVAAVPVMVWVHDSFVSLVRVRGSSMEPTLRDGDILVVRKSDGLWQKYTRRTRANDQYVNGNGSGNVNDVDLERRRQDERDRSLDFEKVHCSSNGPSWLVHKPPMPVTGNLVVYKDPSAYYNSPKWNIKRVVGLGGQVVLLPSNRFRKSSTTTTSTTTTSSDDDGIDTRSMRMRIASPCVPPYSLWVEGDNFAKSEDSARHGPISKKLLVGIAEYRIWPPTRMGSLQDCDDERSEPKPQSYWP